MQTAALGLLLHFVIATGMAAAYVIASRVLPILLRLPLIFGALLWRRALWRDELRDRAAFGVTGKTA
ncbi:MAG: hypothetical protein WDM79_10085 [Terricaulis sp.]